MDKLAMILMGAAFTLLAVDIGFALFAAMAAGVLTYYGARS